MFLLLSAFILYFYRYFLTVAVSEHATSWGKKDILSRYRRNGLLSIDLRELPILSILSTAFGDLPRADTRVIFFSGPRSTSSEQFTLFHTVLILLQFSQLAILPQLHRFDDISVKSR